MAKQNKKQLYKDISELSGMNIFAAKTLVREYNAKYGIGAKAFLKNRAWELDENELVELGDSLSKKKEERKQKEILQVSRENNISPLQLSQQIKKAEAELGMDYRVFLDNAGWELSDDELAALSDRLDRIDQINRTAKELGVSREEIIEYIKTANAEGISGKTFFENRAWENNTQDYYALKNRVQRVRYFTQISEETGVPVARIAHMYYKLNKYYGASFEDFQLFRMWEIDESEWSEYATAGYSGDIKRALNTKEGLALIENKIYKYGVIGKYLNRKYCISDEVTVDELQELASKSGRVLYKPAISQSGYGVEVYEIGNQKEAKVVHDIITSKPKGVVEEYLIQHPVLSQLNPSSLNTVRVVTVVKENAVHIVFASLKIGGEGAIVDSTHQRGLVANIDVETGVVCTDAVDIERNIFKETPSTKIKIKGLEIPYWNEVKGILDDLCISIPGLKYIGWDIGITEDGPAVIEGNAAPSPLLLQLPYAVIYNKGVRSVFKPFEQ